MIKLVQLDGMEKGCLPRCLADRSREWRLRGLW